MKEKDLTKKIIDYLNTLPQTFAFRVENRPGMAHGCSDVLGVYKKYFMAIEAKMPGNKCTPLQLRFLKMVHYAGGLTLVAYSLQDVKDFLEYIIIKKGQ